MQARLQVQRYFKESTDSLPAPHLPALSSSTSSADRGVTSRVPDQESTIIFVDIIRKTLVSPHTAHLYLAPRQMACCAKRKATCESPVFQRITAGSDVREQGSPIQ